MIQYKYCYIYIHILIDIHTKYHNAYRSYFFNP